MECGTEIVKAITFVIELFSYGILCMAHGLEYLIPLS